MAVVEHEPIELRTSPHIKNPLTTDKIMRNVVIALIPVCLFAVYTFGLSALALIVITTGACVITEYLVCRLNNRAQTIGDWSAVITGILLGLTLPPGFPLWMAAVGGIVSIILGKTLFGGLGFNVFNPALVGRAFLQAAFPVAITTWFPALWPGRFTHFIPTTLAFPFCTPPYDAAAKVASHVDGWTGATALSIMKFQMNSEAFKALGLDSLFMGGVAGSAGETSAFFILLGGAYLVARKMMDWRITLSMLGSVFFFSTLFWLFDRAHSPSPLFMLFSGGLMLGAVFMATDMVTSPSTFWGVILFGLLTGLLTVLIRLKGGLPEGVMYAILFGNAVTPLINRVTQPRIYGAVKAKQ